MVGGTDGWRNGWELGGAVRQGGVLGGLGVVVARGNSLSTISGLDGIRPV